MALLLLEIKEEQVLLNETNSKSAYFPMIVHTNPNPNPNDSTIPQYVQKASTLILTGSNNFIPTVPIGRGPTTGEVLASDPRFSTLLIALGAAFGNETGLEAPFTVFAPTNKAFAKIDDETLAGLLEDPDALQEGRNNYLSAKIL